MKAINLHSYAAWRGWQVVLAALFAALSVSVYAPAQNQPIELPPQTGDWSIEQAEPAPLYTEPIRISINAVGTFEANPAEVEQHRPGIFQPGRFSVFDLIAHLSKIGHIDLEYHCDETIETHVIDSLNGKEGWWYNAFYDGGWSERNVTRIDLYPVKDRMMIQFFRQDAKRLEQIYDTFVDEVNRLEQNYGLLVIPEVRIKGPHIGEEILSFQDVTVTPRGVREDLFQTGVVTALDILLSLGKQGHLSGLALSWYESIGSADPVDHYFVESIEAVGFSGYASGSCGFVYEVGPEDFSGFDGSHIHIPTDARVIVSPEYAYWFWICL